MNDHLTRERDAFAARVGLGLRELDDLEQSPDVSEAVRRRLAGAGRSLPETPRRRPVLLLLAALLALAVTATLMWQSRGGGAAGQEAGQTQDPQATQLVYRTAEAPDAEQREALLKALQQRLGDFGTATCDGRTVTIRVADASKAARVRELVEGHRLEMRVLADADYTTEAGAPGGQVRFDMPAERAKLQLWLDAGGAARVLADPDAIREFEAESRWLRWHSHLIRPRADRPEEWGFRFTDAGSLRASVVFVGDAGDWNNGRVPNRLREAPEEQRQLIELVAINMHEWHVDETHLDPAQAKLVQGANGQTAVQYGLSKSERTRYSDLSEKYLGKAMAMLWDDRVLTAPIFRGRIPGIGIIEALPPQAVENLVKVLHHPLPLPLEFVR